MCHSFGCTKDGFTIIEVIATLVLLGLMAIFLTPVLTNVVRGYVMTRSTDAVTQKAQIALQRMTIELSYLSGSLNPDGKSSLTYTSNFNGVSSESHAIFLNGTNVMYNQNSVPYLLLDSVSENGLFFNCYDTYNSNTTSECGSNTNIVGISIIMHGHDWANGLTQTFSTRVAVRKLSR